MCHVGAWESEPPAGGSDSGPSPVPGHYEDPRLGMAGSAFRGAAGFWRKFLRGWHKACSGQGSALAGHLE